MMDGPAFPTVKVVTKFGPSCVTLLMLPSWRMGAWLTWFGFTILERGREGGREGGRK